MIASKRILITLTLLAIGLSGCAPGPQRPTDTDTTIPSQDPGRELTEIELLLLQAESAPPLAKAQYTLEAAAQLINDGEPERARSLLERLNPVLLSDLQQQQRWLLMAELAALKDTAQDVLNELDRIQAPELLTDAQRSRIAELRAANLGLLDDPSAAALALINYSSTLPADQQHQLADKIWRQLTAIDDEALNQLLDQQQDYLVQGWLELSRAMRKISGDIAQTSTYLGEWLSLWSLHPAAEQLPTAISQLQTIGKKPISHIALFLPQSGKLTKPAQALIEGFMAAYYQARDRGDAVPNISLFDSETIADIDLFFLQAELRGIDMVIGPLEKQKLALLAERPLLGITTLGMNYLETPNQTPDLFQFGLRGEDEAQQAARRAWDDGHRIALTVTPDTVWGERILRAFRNEWQGLGGVIAASEQFEGNNDFSNKVSRLLGVDQSEARAAELRQLASEKIEFDPRRRQDVDFIFLTALSKDARQIKPTLAFYFAGDLPVYATSHVYGGKPEPTRDRDLDGILFSDTAWVLHPENPLRREIEQHRTDADSRFGRLYALGADAYRLAPYLTELQKLPEAHLEALSGNLHVEANGEVTRNLQWATFHNGRLRVLPKP